MTGDELPADSNVVAVTGPWTVLSCIAASCTRCGKAPLDEDTKLTPHFTDTAQAREELTRDWGWTCTPRSNWPKDDVLLCPACAAPADSGGNPAPPARDAGGGQEPGAVSWWEALAGRAGEPLRRELPANTAVPPATGTAREEG